MHYKKRKKYRKNTERQNKIKMSANLKEIHFIQYEGVLKSSGPQQEDLSRKIWCFFHLAIFMGSESREKHFLNIWNSRDAKYYGNNLLIRNTNTVTLH